MGELHYKKLLDWLHWDDSTDGDDMEWLAEAARERGQPIPVAVSKKPTLAPDAIFYWQAYTDLISCANSRGVIPWTAYDQYAQRYGEQTDRLRRIVGELINGAVSDRHTDKHERDAEVNTPQS